MTEKTEREKKEQDVGTGSFLGGGQKWFSSQKNHLQTQFLELEPQKSGYAMCVWYKMNKSMNDFIPVSLSLSLFLLVSFSLFLNQ